MLLEHWSKPRACRATAYLDDNGVNGGLYTGQQRGRSNEAPHSDVYLAEEMIQEMSLVLAELGLRRRALEVTARRRGVLKVQNGGKSGTQQQTALDAEMAIKIVCKE